jgi:hypothetical protein
VIEAVDELIIMVIIKPTPTPIIMARILLCLNAPIASKFITSFTFAIPLVRK